MSFKIFSLQLSGKIKPTESIENKRKLLLADFEAYKTVENSAELKKYLELEKWVNSDEFKKKKSEIESLHFKGSKEFNVLIELERLKRSKKIKNFFKVEGSADLTKFEKLKDAQKIKEYNELFEYVKTGQFANDKRNYKEQQNSKKEKSRFEETEAFKKYSRFKQLKNDSEIKFFQKFEKSLLYRNYLDVNDSNDLKRYYELKESVESEEFKQRKAYLEDKNKWQKTDEYTRQQEYLALKKQPNLVMYFSYKDGNAFDFFKNWAVTFEDDFTAAKLDEKKWSGKTYIGEKMLGDNYSMAGDLQAYTNGKNTKTLNKLSIEVRKERSTGKVWQQTSGFLPVEMDFTSGIVSSWPSFWQEDGIFEAKIKFSPVKQVVSSFYLTGEHNMPRINILESGAKNRVGIISFANGKPEVDGLDISNLKRDKWYIFTLEKEGSTIVWKINEVEVFRTQTSSFNEQLHLNASVLVVDEIPGSQLPVIFEIDWVKCYRKV